jgi:hypothetical protein
MGYTDYSSRDDGLIEKVKNRLRADLETLRMPELVTLYFDPEGPFAGRDFDHLGSNPPNWVTIDDLLATSLLDITWSPLVVRKVLNELPTSISTHLAKIGQDTDFWDASDQELRAADDLWDTLVGVDGIKKLKPAS